MAPDYQRIFTIETLVLQRSPFTLALSKMINNSFAWWIIFTKDFAKEWVEYAFNPIALGSIAVTKELIFCNAIPNAQCERNLILKDDRQYIISINL